MRRTHRSILKNIRSQRGASLMEAVLFLPILFMMTWGMIDLARIGMT